MPSLPIAPNILRFLLSFKVGNDLNALTRLYFHYSGSVPNSAQLATLAALSSSTAATQFPSLMPSTNSYQGTTIEDLSSSTGASAADFTAHVGTRTGHPNAAGVAVLVNYHIARRYRGGKPRGYWPFGVAEDLTDEQDWAAAFTTAVDTALDNYIAAMVGPQWSGGTIDAQYNVSFYSGFTVVTNPVSHRAKNVSTARASVLEDLITSITVNAHPASQRRRNRP
jgi:hypothetical protein